MALRSANVEFSAAAGAIIVGIMLVVTSNYAIVFRALGLLLPLCTLTMVVSGWQRGTNPEREISPTATAG